MNLLSGSGPTGWAVSPCFGLAWFFSASQAAFGPAGEFPVETPAGNSGHGPDGGLGDPEDSVCEASLSLDFLGQLAGQPRGCQDFQNLLGQA